MVEKGLGFRAPNLRFFWFGLGYIIVCDVTFLCIQVRIIILIKELARDAGRKLSASTNIRNINSEPEKVWHGLGARGLKGNYYTLDEP